MHRNRNVILCYTTDGFYITKICPVWQIFSLLITRAFILPIRIQIVCWPFPFNGLRNLNIPYIYSYIFEREVERVK